jgi:repressor LexA
MRRGGLTLTLQNIIKSYREETGTTMQALADRAGLSKGYISMLESGKNPKTKKPIAPSMAVLSKIASAMGMSVNSLIAMLDDDQKISLTPEADTAPSKPAPDFDIFSISNILPLPEMVAKPLIGTIACGTPILAIENIEDRVMVPKDIRCDFVLRCKGDSMINACIMDGSLVYVREQPDVENGEIAAIRIGDEVTLKRVYKYENRLELRAENPLYGPLNYEGSDLDQVQILGKAVIFQSVVL